ncbi:hypothetical protein V6Z11_A04G119700 [Gossypium hirsutum]
MDPIKFTEMELVDDEDVETMVALYCHSNQNAPMHLFAELAIVESTEDPTPLGEEDGPQEFQSTTHGIDIDLNATPETDVGGDDVYQSSDPSDYEVDIDSDPDVDDVPDDIDDEGVNEDGNINASLVGNQIRRIVIHNNPGAYMSRIDPDAAHAAEFPEYLKILPAHQMAIYSDPEELFVGQRFKTAFIQKYQMWEIRKFVGPHTCTSTRMTEDHRKLDSKTICTCIMPMVEDMPTIKVWVLITKMQARFQYRVSYRKAWIAKQMAIEQLYRHFDASYNELQGWIAAMREYVSGIVIELQT